jgi:hypothetical protein
MQQRSFFLETKDCCYINPIPFAAHFQFEATVMLFKGLVVALPVGKQ